MIHPTAIVETESIGADTNIWAYAHVMSGAIVGRCVNVGDHAFIEGGVQLGDNVTIKNGVCLWDGITIEEDVFVGPNVTFTNDRFPRSPRMQNAKLRYAARENWLAKTKVRRGCSIGAAATICPGVELGAYATIGAGAVVTKDVAPFSLVVGNPAKKVGEVCSCGVKLNGSFSECECLDCGETGEARQQLLVANTRRSQRPSNSEHEQLSKF